MNTSNFWTFIGFGVLFGILLVVLLSVAYIIFNRYSSASGSKDDDHSDITANSDNNSYSLISPLSGELIPLSSVNDDVFSQGILGQGFAIIPDKGQLYAPANAKIVDIFDTKHAISFECDNGIELLIHVGLDTVKLNGAPFNPIIHAGDHVTAGELIMEFDREMIIKEGYDIVTPVIVTNCEKYNIVTREAGKVMNGEPVATLTSKED